MGHCGFTIYDMIARNAGLFAEKCALVHGGRRLSFEGYRRLCDRAAEMLLKEGVEKGERIALLSENSDDYLIICGGAARTGSVVVPLNYRLGEEELEYIIRDSGAKRIFTGDNYGETSKRLAALPGIELKSLNLTAAAREEATGVSDAPEKRGEGSCDNGPGADDAFMIIYTAAVGGHPRGCVLSHSNLLAVAFQLNHLLKLSGDDCHVVTLPLFHIGGFPMTLAVMQQGGKNVLLDRFDPLRVLEEVEKEEGTFFGTFPPMLAAILDVQDKHSIKAPSLRGVGGVDAPDTVQRFLKNNPHAVFYSLYGQTEAMPVSGGDSREKPGSVGLPGIMTRVVIMDDSDRQVPAGVSGEICVRSPSVFMEYWNLKSETLRTFRNGWHHTGDLGRLDDEGVLWYEGRKPEKELIKPGGENVYPAEVEQVILSQGSIDEVCVIGVPDSEWGEAVKAVCVCGEGRVITEDEITSFVASKIARYKKPKYVVFVDSMPKNPEGGIDREAVKKTHGDVK
ncbi:MAG TPA: long-chain fatty acid--CoA ligase [Deltaproteobacteria bacterium]|nr:long-chain fatty acid--CoA ligase [Deltaproteobacteria bacterium]